MRQGLLFFKEFLTHIGIVSAYREKYLHIQNKICFMHLLEPGVEYTVGTFSHGCGEPDLFISGAVIECFWLQLVKAVTPAPKIWSVKNCKPWYNLCEPLAPQTRAVEPEPKL